MLEEQIISHVAFLIKMCYNIKNILIKVYSYEGDFSKHAPNETVPRIRMVWQSIPSQLAKENKKFVYGV